RVDGRAYRADRFARGVLAVHARDRQEGSSGISDVPGVVGVDAEPEHLAPDLLLVPTDDGDVVLGLAGDDTGVASDARGRIDGHAPLVLFGVVVVRVEGVAARGLFESFVNDFVAV